MKSMLRYLGCFGRDTTGAIAVMWGLALPVVVGGLALSSDVGKWYYTKRDLQNATDTAALASGYDISGNNSSETTMYYTARREMQRHGIDLGVLTLTTNYPPGSGNYAGNTSAVEIIASIPDERYFTQLFMDSDPTVSVRAVALRQSAGSACVLALDELRDDALLFQGNTTINLNSCIAASNSTSTSAISISGNSTLNANNIYSAGGYEVVGNGDLNTTGQPVTNATPIDDPYSGLNVPSYSGCGGGNNLNINNTRTIDPGVYCGGIDFRSNANVTMNPGTYIIDRGEFKVNGQARITGSGVTIILTSSTGSSYATLTINGGATVTLSAPTSGTYAGVLFYQDRDAPVVTSGNPNKFNGGSTTNLTGAVYFPKQEVQFSGNSSNGGGACTKIVAKVITFIGTSNFTNTCPASVSEINIPGTVTLVE